MRDLPNIRRAVSSYRWAIVPEKLEAMIEVLEMRLAKGSRFSTEEIEARREAGLIDSPRLHAAARASQTAKGGKVAVLPLAGLIMPKSSMVNGESLPSGTSCEQFAKMFDAAVADPGVSAIVIDIDSPGGSVAGVPELAARIFNGRGSKPIVAVANGLAASAAYWLGTQADEFIVAPSGEVGSIGVFCVHEDASGYFAQLGVKHTIIKAGEFKAEGNPYEPISDEAVASIQEDIDTFYSMFISAVAKGRGVGVATVQKNFGKGRTVLAKNAVASGMADRVGTLEGVLRKFGVSGGTSSARADDFDIAIAASEDITGPLLSSMVAVAMDAIKPTMATAGVAAAGVLTLHASQPTPQGQEFIVPTETAAASPSGAATTDNALTERRRVTQITALSRDHGIEASVSDSMIERGLSIAEASREILDLKRADQKKAPVIRSVVNRAENDPRRGFKSHRGFLLSVMEAAGARDRSQVGDERLRPLAVFDKDDKQAAGGMAFVLPYAFTPPALLATAGSDEQGEYSDTYGGFAVPATRLPGMLKVGFEGDPTAGRTQNIPMASPVVEIMARTDKDHSSSVSGGFTVTRRPETVAITASRMQLELITLKASGLFGLAYATEELLADSPVSFAAIIASGFADQFPAAILNEKIRGQGGNEFLGVLNSPAKIEVAKETGQAADTINSTNIIKMAARSWGFSKAIWIANHDTKPQLAVLSIAIGTAGALLYQPSRTEGFPDMLWGRPIFYSEYASTVGDVGDLMLVDWSQYLEGTYQPLQSAESIHVRFINHERTFKFWMRNAGAPWWRTALTPAKSAVTLSPIVTLAARA